MQVQTLPFYPYIHQAAGDVGNPSIHSSGFLMSADLPYRSATVWSAAKVGKAFGISKRFAYFCCALSLMEVYPTILRSEVWAFGKPKGERLEPLCKRNVNDKNNREKNGIRSTSY